MIVKYKENMYGNSGIRCKNNVYIGHTRCLFGCKYFVDMPMY